MRLQEIAAIISAVLLFLLCSCNGAGGTAQGGVEPFCKAVGNPSNYMFGNQYEVSQTYDCYEEKRSCVKVVSLESGQSIYNCNIPVIHKEA